MSPFASQKILLPLPAPRHPNSSTASVGTSASNATAFAPNKPISIGFAASSSSTINGTLSKWAKKRSQLSSAISHLIATLPRPLKTRLSTHCSSFTSRSSIANSSSSTASSEFAVQLDSLWSLAKPKRERSWLISKIDYRLMAHLLYGSGLRLLEAVRLRVKDIDFSYNRITILQGKGRHSRITILPARLKRPLQAHLARVHELHRQDLARGGRPVTSLTLSIANTSMPLALGRG